MVSVVIVGVLAALAFTQHGKLMERKRAEMALMALRTIHGRAQMIYTKYGSCSHPEWAGGVPAYVDGNNGINKALDISLPVELDKYFVLGYHANCFDQTAPFVGDLAHASRRDKTGKEVYVLVLFPEPLSDKNPGCHPNHLTWPCPVPERMCENTYCGS